MVLYRFDHFHDITNRPDIMDPHHPSAFHHCDGHRGRRPHEAFADRTAQNFPDKGFAGNPDHQVTTQYVEGIEPIQ